MTLVYSLALDLIANPESVANTQALTLDGSRPLMGLRGTHGLFASQEWWSNLEAGVIPVAVRTGIIERLYFAGQDARWGDEVNSFSVRLADGSLLEESIVSNDKPQCRLYRVGSQVTLRYALEERKLQPAPEGGVNYSWVLLDVELGSPS